ncbi:MAG: inner membrane CreD family protein, partial [Bacteroidota bacterium]
MNAANESVIEKFRNWIKQSLLIKTISIGIIMLLLMIPNTLIKEIIRERNYYQEDAIRDVSAKWGNEQQLVGPILTIPYKSIYVDSDDKQFETIKYSHFLPEQMHVLGNIHPENRKRGIYNVILYQSDLECTGWINNPNPADLGV